MAHTTTSGQRSDPSAASSGPTLALEVFSYEDRRILLPRLHRILAVSGCWLERHRNTPCRAVEYTFEIPLGDALDLYCALVQAGVGMTDLSHRTLTAFCTLHRQQPASGQATSVRVTLKVSFIDVDLLEVPGLPTTPA